VKIDNDGVHEWHYKCSHRNYWRVTAWKSGIGAPVYGCEGVFDDLWDFNIHVDGEVAYYGVVEIQNGISSPEPEDLIAEYAAYVTSVAIGVAKSKEEWYGKTSD